MRVTVPLSLLDILGAAAERESGRYRCNLTLSTRRSKASDATLGCGRNEMASQRPGYAYIWEYSVRPECVADFEKAYGPSGPWVELFRRAGGYVRTELHRDRRNANRYLTIDYWESAEAWEAFRSGKSSEFEAIDARCEGFTLEEHEIGRLDPIG
jgi:heme-degrading monooxygenase HmoA